MPTTLRAAPAVLTTSFRDAGCLPGLRAWIREHVTGDELRGDVELVCTELVTNAVEHARGPRSVVVVVQPGGARIEVTDGSPTTAPVPGRSRFGGEMRGRGLTLVAALSRWEVRRVGRRKTVTALLPA
ncbi:ATP-binding protein [Pseudonocardia xishanensis]|uniref:Histidine kinase/HSP90-like ATPase domain-containing protein n=1 Tax=Pseudonocardia xishanensis TaxID=630995 RepID=A0ABP8RY19_9PSEU